MSNEKIVSVLPSTKEGKALFYAVLSEEDFVTREFTMSRREICEKFKISPVTLDRVVRESFRHIANA